MDISKPFLDENSKWALRETTLDGSIKIHLCNTEKEAYKLRNKLIVNVDSIFDNLPDNLTSFGVDVPQLPKTPTTDFQSKKKEIEEGARIVMGTLISCYFSADLISKKEYLKIKAKIDSEHLSSLMFALQNAEYGSYKILEQIDISETPNIALFDALGKMQKTLLDIIKIKTEYLQFLEKNYKMLSETDDNERPEDVQEITKELNEPLKIKGTRDLIIKLREGDNTFEVDPSVKANQDKYDPRNKISALLDEKSDNENNEINDNIFG